MIAVVAVFAAVVAITASMVKANKVDCVTFYSNNRCTQLRSSLTLGRELQTTYCIEDTKNNCSVSTDYRESYNFQCRSDHVLENSSVFLLWDSDGGCTGETTVNVTIPEGVCTFINYMNLYVMLECNASPPQSEESVFLYTFFLFGGVGLGLLVVFSCAQKRFKKLYHGRNFSDAKKGAEVTHPLKGYFGWIVTSWKLTNDELFERCGLDIMMYIVLYRKLLWAFSWCSLYTFIVLVPVSIYGGGDFEGIESVSVSNVLPGSYHFLAHAVSIYIYSYAIMRALYSAYHIYSTYHARFLQRRRVETFGILVRDIPIECESEEDVLSYFREMYDGDVKTAVRVMDVSEIQAIANKRKEVKRLHDRALYKVYKGKPATTHEGRLPGMCCGGKEVDALELYRDKLADLNDQYAFEKTKLKKCPKFSSSAVVLFNSATTAFFAQQVIHSATPYTWTVYPLPQPSNMEWRNLALSSHSRLVRGVLVSAATIALGILWAIPISFISALFSVNSLTRVFPSLENEEPGSPVLWLIESIVPSLILLLFTSLLPPLMRYLSFLEGHFSISLIERGMIVKLYWFQVVNVFLVSLILGSVIPIINDLRDNPAEIVNLLGESVPHTGFFFSSYVMLRVFLDYPLKLFRIGEVVLVFVKSKFLSATPAEVEEANKPEEFSIPEEFTEDALIFVIGVTYATINPIVVPFLIAYCLISIVVNSYMVFFIRKQKYDGGQLWRIIFNQMMSSLMISQGTILCVLAVNKSPSSAGLVFALMILTIIFWRTVLNGIASIGEKQPLEEIVRNKDAPPDDIVSQYIQPEAREDDNISFADEEMMSTSSLLAQQQQQRTSRSKLPLISNLLNHPSKSGVEPSENRSSPHAIGKEHMYVLYKNTSSDTSNHVEKSSMVDSMSSPLIDDGDEEGEEDEDEFTSPDKVVYFSVM
eukprot:m.171056 g.171056  ORF g.171056 m.171056 type:complete len:928 (-) comp13494_c0_seq3:1563-4346(-)